MKLTRSQWIRIIVALAVVLAVGACGKKKVATAAAAPATTAPGAYCLVDSQSQYHSSGPGEHFDVED